MANVELLYFSIPVMDGQLTNLLMDGGRSRPALPPLALPESKQLPHAGLNSMIMRSLFLSPLLYQLHSSSPTVL
jgi:hypothetical protein